MTRTPKSEGRNSKDRQAKRGNSERARGRLGDAGVLLGGLVLSGLAGLVWVETSVGAGAADAENPPTGLAPSDYHRKEFL